MSIDQNTTTPAPAALTKKQAKKAAKAAKKKALTPGQKKFRNYAITAVAAYCIGALVSSNASTPEPVALPAPETVTKTVEVEVPAELPQVCKDAFGNADAALHKYEGVGPLASEAVDAIVSNDMIALDGKTAEMEDLGNQITGAVLSYAFSKQNCEDELGTTLPGDF